MGLMESTGNDNLPVILIVPASSRWMIMFHDDDNLFLLLFMCFFSFFLLSTMNVNIVTVNISGGDMDAIISFKRVVFDKCFTTELHIMEQKPDQKTHTSPSRPGRGERKEQPEAS